MTTTPLTKHLGSILACSEAREWAGERTPQQAWDDTTRPDWLIWWRLRVHPEDRAAMLLVIVPLLREHTLPLCREQDRAVCATALDAAEAWARNPTQRAVAHTARSCSRQSGRVCSRRRGTITSSMAARSSGWTLSLHQMSQSGRVVSSQACCGVRSPAHSRASEQARMDPRCLVRGVVVIGDLPCF